ncbi:hypothetical protein GAO09_08430 [Rhizobiales bacterium RZME27]|uniref:Uncharacterized protein n=1 Tax=Endobacterium cereale TaxID=2663029 RepID=A0A6A8ABA4_9HYPH|nr:hypothetical protein [Endobacterium cereale]MEB2848214.1 hypothetical protein [Endobacterium cereale]MQY46081.1 hypothetical protein [Endobacterium cereale]
MTVANGDAIGTAGIALNIGVTAADTGAVTAAIVSNAKVTAATATVTTMRQVFSDS